jgi:hypothetical protein
VLCASAGGIPGVQDLVSLPVHATPATSRSPPGGSSSRPARTHMAPRVSHRAGARRGPRNIALTDATGEELAAPCDWSMPKRDHSLQQNSPCGGAWPGRLCAAAGACHGLRAAAPGRRAGAPWGTPQEKSRRLRSESTDLYFALREQNAIPG